MAIKLGNLESYDKGGIEIINDDPHNYAFSNLFEVASKSSPYERVVVALNNQYVLEAVRAEGESAWFAAPHDETVIIMDGQVEVTFIKPSENVVFDSDEGAIQLDKEPSGVKMGRIIGSGINHILLPKGSAYKFRAIKTAAMLMQGILGPLSNQKWSEICQSENIYNKGANA